MELIIKINTMTKAIEWFYGLVWYAGEFGVREIYREKGKLYSYTEVLDLTGEDVQTVIDELTNMLKDIKSGFIFELKNGELKKLKRGKNE